MILKNGTFDLPKGLNRKLDLFTKINPIQKQVLLQNCNIITEDRNFKGRIVQV
ncbi:MAG: hypothetical protein J0M15_16275 [Deltaproteobacteria bacterium]|jgi:hypothetical protein|nr:hypothetical protein [Deltaproteobacteria bacterium]